MPNPEQLFVVGNSRSGTTMMGRILGNHSDIFTFRELHFFGQLWSSRDLNKQLNRNESVKLFSKLLRINKYGIFARANLNQFNNISESELPYEDIYPLDVFKKFLRWVNKTSIQ